MESMVIWALYNTGLLGHIWESFLTTPKYN